MKKKALVAMSGGVDSSVCAYLAQKAGYECIGATMRLCGRDFNSTDARDAAKVCELLGMEHRVFDFSEEFEAEVIARFVDSYERGATPNPCVVCNKYLKFGLLFDKAKELGCDTIITGHYARIEDGVLKKAYDLSKDQSYVLWSIPREILSHIFFPLGCITKAEARKTAEEQGFVTARKSDSQDICFVPDGDYAAFLERRKTYPKGDFTDTNGRVLGTHQGIIRYTVGQRKGLGIAFGEPMYVKEKDAKNNRVVLCRNEELFGRELTAGNVNWLVPPETENMRVKAKIRYNQSEQSALVHCTDTVKVVFDEPQRAIAKGQSVVFYDGDTVLGGGVIE